VLIILDNTANWNNAFTNEKNALVSVINGLSDQFNVGLMMMAETGGSNDNVDGGYIRYHVRQMTNTNKTALSSLVNNLDKLGDKGNNNTVGLALHEAYLYFSGKASISTYGKVKAACGKPRTAQKPHQHQSFSITPLGRLPEELYYLHQQRVGQRKRHRARVCPGQAGDANRNQPANHDLHHAQRPTGELGG
jgi:hypothetical protein